MKAYLSSSAAPPLDYQGFPVDQPKKAVLHNQTKASLFAANIPRTTDISDPKATEALLIKDKQIKDLEQKMIDLQRREQSLTSHAETLELRTLQNQRGGPGDQAMNQNLKQVNMEKALLEGQLQQMRQDMKGYLDSLKEGMMTQQQ